VVVTRPKDRAGRLADLIEERGGTVVLAPAIELVPAPAHALDEAARAAVDGEFEWVVFTSPAGAEALLDRMPAKSERSGTIRARVAAVGEGTARTLRALGVEPDLVPGTFTTHALGRALPRGTGRVLLARADVALSELEAEVAAKGWTAVRVDAYRTRPARRLPAEARWVLRERRADAVTFTSASTVDGFLRLAGGESLAGEPRPRIVCIGPVTARAATVAGLTVDGVARPHTIEGLVAALERAMPPGASGKESR
jgi:uroporphyrinogen-III synthase